LAAASTTEQYKRELGIGFYGRDTPAKAATIGNDVFVYESKIPNAGRALFAADDFADGNWITEYDGELIDKKTADARLQQGKDTHIRSLEFGHSFVDGFYCTNTRGRGGASFANDPWTLGKNVASGMYNAKFEKFQSFDPKVGVKTRTGDMELPNRVFLRAIKRIKKGDEIYVDYGKDFWDRHPL
jgi:SET domain-containing protein